MTIASMNALLSPSDVADLAGVKRPVVSNWRKRHANLPAAVAGTEAKPLFARDAVVDWLRQRGHKVEDESAGGRIWSALNAIRDRLPLEEAADFVLLLATLKLASQSDFDKVAHEHPADQAALLASAVSKLRKTPGLEGFREPSEAVLRLQPNASLVVDAVARSAGEDLAQAVDFVLERLSRWQIKGGAESGFIGSRTSSLLATLVGQTGGTVYDPACGIANVLTRIAEQGSANRLVGSDIDRDALRIAAQRAFLRRSDIVFVAGDVLAIDPDPNLQADVVVAEPPFGMSWDSSSKLADPIPGSCSASRRRWLRTWHGYNTRSHTSARRVGRTCSRHRALCSARDESARFAPTCCRPDAWKRSSVCRPRCCRTRLLGQRCGRYDAGPG